MRVMVIVPGDRDSEAGKMPSEELIAKMTTFNEELVRAGVMLAGEGLTPTSKAKRVRFSGAQRTVIESQVELPAVAGWLPGVGHRTPTVDELPAQERLALVPFIPLRASERLLCVLLVLGLLLQFLFGWYLAVDRNQLRAGLSSEVLHFPDFLVAFLHPAFRIHLLSDRQLGIGYGRGLCVVRLLLLRPFHGSVQDFSGAKS